MMNSHLQILQNQIVERQENGLDRSLISANHLIDFCSNDYLGLAKNQTLADKIQADFNQLKSNLTSINGSTGSRLISGQSVQIEQFERKCAEFHQAEASL